MFIPEVERNRALREQQRREYREALKQQINQKNNRPTNSPLPYSTTTNDTYQPHGSIAPYGNNRILERNRNNNDINRGFNNRLRNRLASKINNYVPTALAVEDRPYPSVYSAAGSSLNYEPLPNFVGTKIPPLNIAVTNFVMEAIPDLPRKMHHGSVVDPRTFPERIGTLRSQIELQLAELQRATDVSDRIRINSFPDLNKAISELGDLLEKTVSAKIPSAISRVTELISHNRELVDTNSHLLNSQIETIKEILSDRNQTILSFGNRFSDFSEHTRSTIHDIKSEAGRAHDVQDFALQKILSLENRGNAMVEEIAHCNSSFADVDNEVTGKFTVTQRDVDNLLKTISQQLATEVKREAEQRVQASAVLHNQVEEVNKRATESILGLQTNIAEISELFSHSLTDLSSQISSAFEQTQVENDEVLNDVSARLDQLIMDTESCFDSFTSELVATVSDLRSIFTTNRTTLEDSFRQEAQTRERNHRLILSKYEHLRNIVAREEQVQTSKFQELCSKVQENASVHSKKISDPLVDDFVYIKTSANKIDKAEASLDSLETNMQTLENQVFESIAALQRSHQDLIQSVSDTRTSIMTDLDDISVTLSAFESSDKSNMVIKQEILDSAELVSSDTDARIKFIGTQLEQIMRNLSTFTLGENYTSHITTPSGSAVQSLPKNVRNAETSPGYIRDGDKMKTDEVAKNVQHDVADIRHSHKKDVENEVDQHQGTKCIDDSNDNDSPDITETPMPNSATSES